MKKTNLDEKIYTFCYSEPHYQREIIANIYRDEIVTPGKTTIISNKMKQLEKKGYVRPIEIFKKPNDVAEYRMEKRKYYISTAKPIIDEISMRIKLTSNEQNLLNNVLEHEAVRKLFQKTKRHDTIQGLTRTISILALTSSTTFNYLSIYYSQLRRLPRKNIINEIKKNKKFLSKIQLDTIKEMNKFSSKLFSFPMYDVSKKIEHDISLGAIEFFSLEEGLTRKLATLTPDFELIIYLLSSAYTIAEHKPPHKQ